MILIVSGVAGSGKSTVGAMLAGMLRWRFTDGDSFHSEANVAKMRSGIPLTDEDRDPWLRAMADWMDAQIAAGRSGVLACSCLKRTYRDRLLSGRPSATVIFLEVGKDVLFQRLSHRPGHFFTQQLLQSQLDILEPPAPDERVRTVPAEDGPAKTAARIVALLWPDGQPDSRPGSQPDAAQ